MALDCLSRYNYKEEKCQSQIDALYECCRAFYDKYGDQERTVSCPKPDLLRFVCSAHAPWSTDAEDLIQAQDQAERG